VSPIGVPIINIVLEVYGFVWFIKDAWFNQHNGTLCSKLPRPWTVAVSDILYDQTDHCDNKLKPETLT
jgi:hypothetical protein